MTIQFRRGVLVTIMLPGLLLGIACTAGAAKDPALLERMHEMDRAMHRGYFIVAKLSKPAHPFDPEQGREISFVRKTSGEQGRAFVSTSRFSRAPRYRDLYVLDYKPVDFSAEGHLIYWRSSRVWHLSAEALNRTLVEWETGRVTPENDVMNSSSHVQLQRYASGNLNSLPDANHLLLILGRGFGPHLRSIESVEDSPEGWLRVLAKGSYGQGYSGRWVLWVDPEAFFLVRRAEFFSDATGDRVLSMHNSGLVRGEGVPVAHRGWIEFPLDKEGRRAPIRVEVDLKHFRSTFDLGLWREAQEAVTRTLPEGAEILDYVTERPRRSFIGE